VPRLLHAFTVLTVVTAANADTAPCGAPLLNTCVNADTLWPHPGHSTFSSIGGTRTAEPGQVGLGLVATYQSRPVVLQVASPGPGAAGSKEAVIDDQVNVNFLWNIGITRRLELGVAMPVTLGQSGSGLASLSGGNSEIKPTALRDLRFGLSYALMSEGAVATVPGFSLAARMFMSAPTAEGGGFAGERGAAFLPSLTAQIALGRFLLASEAGLRVRAITEFAGARVGTQGAIALGAGFQILEADMLTALAEVRALPGFAEQSSLVQTGTELARKPLGTVAAPAEWSVGARTAPIFGGDLSFALQGGGALPLSDVTPVTTPRFRFTLGIRYAPIARDTDGDGIIDKLDRCPNERPGVLPPDAPKDGCAHPELMQPARPEQPIEFVTPASVTPAAPLPSPAPAPPSTL
jgi:OmpA-OmpF porin, OOP family